MSIYFWSFTVQPNIDTIPIVHPGTQRKRAGLCVERPLAHVQIAEHLELRWWYPEHSAVGAGDAVCVSIVVQEVARGTETQNVLGVIIRQLRVQEKCPVHTNYSIHVYKVIILSDNCQSSFPIHSFIVLRYPIHPTTHSRSVIATEKDKR